MTRRALLAALEVRVRLIGERRRWSFPDHAHTNFVMQSVTVAGNGLKLGKIGLTGFGLLQGDRRNPNSPPGPRGESVLETLRTRGDIMFRTAGLSKVIVPVIALAAILTLTSSRAEAQVKPLKITGGGFAPEGISLNPHTPAPHSATGNATELGNYTGNGWFQILVQTSFFTAEFSSAPNFVFVAANGDHLAMTYGDVDNGAEQPGEVTLVPNSDGSVTAYFVAEFNPDLPNCTGRFAKLTGGSLIMYAVSDPFFILGASTTPFSYSWYGSGTLTYGK